MLILGIETSCDDTAAAVIEDDQTILSSVINSQDEIHARFGGVVPELASRKHLESIHFIVEQALQKAHCSLAEIDLIAATQGPGLIGSLLVGYNYAKSISYVSTIPFIGVDHMAGHLLSVFLEKDKPEFPYIALIVSGGTSSIFFCRNYNDYTLLGRTKDDAAGEAFDKVAKLLHLDYPGGPHVAKEALSGNAQAFSFPRAWLATESLDFSFSGLKTSVMLQCSQYDEKDTIPIADICASFQEAVIEVLVGKIMLAAQRYDVKNIVLGGGVSANKQLRQAMDTACSNTSLQLFCPQPAFCTDNGAMIALAGYYTYKENHVSTPYDTDVFSRSILG